MDMNKIWDWCDEMIEKYNIDEEDATKLQEIINNIDGEDLYGDEYREEEMYEEDINED